MGAIVVDVDDEIFAIASNGVVIRTRVSGVRATGRDTMGVSLMGVGEATVVAVARGVGAEDADEEDLSVDTEVTESEADVVVETADTDDSSDGSGGE